MTEHTPTPWFARGPVIDSEGHTIGRCVSADPAFVDEDIANAKFIVRAVNAHDEMLAALKWAAQLIGHPEDAASKHIASVIAKAEGRS